MYKIDVYQKVENANKHKFAFSIQFETFDQALLAKRKLEQMEDKVYTYQPGQNRPLVTKRLGGYKASNICQTF